MKLLGIYPPLSSIIFTLHINVTGIYDGGRILDASAHLLSRGFLSQLASITCCTLARVAPFFVLHAVYAILCVYRVFMKKNVDI
jgi:hypothetical protein